jgi:hypothetical protein
MLKADASRQLDDLLQYLAESLDIPAALDDEFAARYADLSLWIREDSESRHRTDSVIYLQGSRRLGTLVVPVRPGQDYDFDLVYLRDLAKSGVTQDELKRQVGEQLARYVESVRRRGQEVPRLEQGARCWTLRWGQRFHMDIVPAIPDDDTSLLSYGGEQIAITDRDLRYWQSSNPRGYAAWFRRRSVLAPLVSREVMADAARVDIEPIPVHGPKTLLQRRVQLLKRHRDLYYEGDPDDRPSSIIVTTLAGRAEQPNLGLYDGLILTVSSMGKLVERRDGVYWVANPINPAENFADRWIGNPQRADRFFEWLGKLESDLQLAGRQSGLERTTYALGVSLGHDAATAAARRFGDAMLVQRNTGTLRAATRTGTLGTSGVIQVASHTFFGGKR